MEKLSKLLNEYLESKKKDIKQFMNIAALMTQSDSKLYQIYIISKDFKFIKRLIENDKIDYQKSPGEIMFDDRMGTTFSLEDSIVMMLSISDTPIDDLISYLK